MTKRIKTLKMKKITFKLFMFTFSILLLFAVMIYVAFYFFLPVFYMKYKQKHLTDEITHIIEKAKDQTLQKEGAALLDTYAANNNATVFVVDKDGHILYSSFTSVVLEKAPIASTAAKGSIGSVGQKKEGADSFKLTKMIHFKEGVYQIRITATLQPIDEATKVLGFIFPYIGFVVFIIGIGSAYVYSRVITKPLLSLNESAQKMADLDFTEKIEMDSNDELGELANSLNDLSINLQESMKELQKANQQLANEIERERKIEKSRRDFLAIVAHELKSPLTILKGHTEGMMYQIGPYQDRDNYLKQNYRIIENMEKLVREILNMSKLEQQTFKPKLERVNLSQMIEEIILNLEFFASEKRIVCLPKITSDVFVTTDIRLLKKAFENIIHNAIMYSPDGEKVYIELFRLRKESLVIFRVINTGTQIKKEELTKIFTPFYRIEKSRNRHTGGTGLGLYSVKQAFEHLKIIYSLKNVDEGVQFLVKLSE